MNVSPGSRHLRSWVALTALVGTITLIPGPSYAAPSDPKPADGTPLDQIHSQLDGLYREAEVATEAYDGANEKATEQSKRLTSLQSDLARAKGRADALHGLAGAAARAQYRGDYFSSAGLQLLLSDHPENALADAARADRTRATLQLIYENQKSASTELDRQTEAAAKNLSDLKKSLADKAGAKEKIQNKIADAERIEAGLKAEQVNGLAQLEKQKADDAKSMWSGSGSNGAPADKGGTGNGPSGGGPAVSGSAGQAVSFAMAQIGKPYGWGDTGPSSYDCSGLTSVAWAHAGHPIPRTSQAQWQGLRRVSLSSAQPGDLIIYFSDATHVGMYIGGGQIVHAPRPRRTITTAPAASMPILGVVRPGG
ncbi:putative endopeptidase [Streptomyces hundungensis]|uniref:Putative endopeptidase n=1 Tax=Streptomyces hundungensis TaxID=1077946 RepID=A0A387HNE9_9ACTN|nr:C40 family peptidase [Streptomyces hundungensis]AYG85074.1 putative endopeptidase [Streptomyces hundungensis]